MKKIIALITLLTFTTFSFAQKKEKVKGTKVVTIEKHESEPFTEIEIEDNVEVYLIKADKNALEVEADENLHATLNKQVYGTTLRLNTNKEVTGFKKFEVRVYYTDSLDMITVKHEAKLNAIQELKLPKLTIKSIDYSKTYINVNMPIFAIYATDKSTVEMNLKAEDATVEVSKNAELKALIAAPKLKLDMYQKSSANVEGDVNELKLRLDNNSTYVGKNMTAKTLNLTTEAYTKCSVNTNGNLVLSMSGKSEVSVFGEPKIEIKKFADEATLMKKLK